MENDFPQDDKGDPRLVEGSALALLGTPGIQEPAEAALTLDGLPSVRLDLRNPQHRFITAAIATAEWWMKERAYDVVANPECRSERDRILGIRKAWTKWMEGGEA